MRVFIAGALCLVASGCATSKWSAETRCRDLRPGEVVTETTREATSPATFGVVVWSEYGATTGRVIAHYQSARPEKQLAELNVLECAFVGWAQDERARLGHK